MLPVKGELNPEMKLCELLVLGHCIHLPLILFACASSGQSYNVGSPVPPNFCDVIDTAMTGDPIAFWSFLNFYRKVLFWSLQASSMLHNWVNDLQFLTRILTKFLKGFYWPKRDEKMYKKVPIFLPCWWCCTPKYRNFFVHLFVSLWSVKSF